MKTVFSNSMCAHVWAHQTQEHGRSSGMAFYGPVINSYVTPIAAIVKNAAGESVALVTSHSYSTTTSSKHMPEVRRALRGLMDSFTVPDLGHSGGKAWSKSKNAAGMHAVNLEYLVAQYHEYSAAMFRSNLFALTSVESIARQLQGDAQKVIGYANAFALDIPFLPVNADAEKISARRVRLMKKWNDPIYAEKRDADKVKREEAKERKLKEARAAERERSREQVAAWLAGELSTYALRGAARTMENGSAMLRIKGDSIETSLGATAPRDHVVRALILWAGVVARGESWDAGERAIHLGHFKLSSIDADGNVRAGCHFIARAEVERISALLAASSEVAA